MAAVLPIVMLGASLAGTALSARAQYQQGQAAEVSGEYNARVAIEEAKYQEEESRAELKKVLGRQRALFAAAGVDIGSGSPLSLMEMQTMEGEREAQNIRIGGLNKAAMYRYGGEQGKKAGTIGALGTFIGGVGTAATTAYGMKKSTAQLTSFGYGGGVG